MAKNMIDPFVLSFITHPPTASDKALIDRYFSSIDTFHQSKLKEYRSMDKGGPDGHLTTFCTRRKLSHSTYLWLYDQLEEELHNAIA